ncbi:hypothetical protein LCGC14_1396350 [marine sediment metagenome]|uniref:Uncharacterized protein n=1 Tax=marine sediment metagenome TaxID=412755 RepID=A0A0F9KJF2_9ZZZZ
MGVTVIFFRMGVTVIFFTFSKSSLISVRERLSGTGGIYGASGIPILLNWPKTPDGSNLPAIHTPKFTLPLNALIMGKLQLVKVSDEGAKTNCNLSLFISLLCTFLPANNLT